MLYDCRPSRVSIVYMYTNFVIKQQKNVVSIWNAITKRQSTIGNVICKKTRRIRKKIAVWKANEVNVHMKIEFIHFSFPLYLISIKLIKKIKKIMKKKMKKKIRFYLFERLWILNSIISKLRLPLPIRITRTYTRSYYCRGSFSPLFQHK